MQKRCDDIYSESESDDEIQDNKITTYGNRIWFYADVTSSNIARLSRELTIMTSNLASINNGFDAVPIHLHIQSLGGDACSALSLLSLINTFTNPVYTYCDGFVASAAIDVYLTGSYRTIGKYSSMLLHQTSSLITGSYRDIADETHNMKILEKIRKQYTLDRTGMTAKQYDDLWKDEKIIDARQAIKYGIAHEII